jgi:hypothetical protein
LAIATTAASLSTLSKVDSSSIPSRIQHADNPVPVPRSRDLPFFFVAASAHSRAPLIQTLEALEGFHVVKMCWSTGIILVTKV